MIGLDRDEAVGAVVEWTRAARGALFVSNGNNSRAAHALDDYPLTFYAMGSMGQCAPLAAGYASVARRLVVALDGDGAAAMGLAGLPLAAAAARAPFVHVVLDNGIYETTGGQEVPVPDGLLTTVAIASGYEVVQTVTSLAELHAGLCAALGESQERCEDGEGALNRPRTVFLRVRTAPTGRPMFGRVPYHPREITERFLAADDSPTTVPVRSYDLITRYIRAIPYGWVEAPRAVELTIPQDQRSEGTEHDRA